MKVVVKRISVFCFVVWGGFAMSAQSSLITPKIYNFGSDVTMAEYSSQTKDSLATTSLTTLPSAYSFDKLSFFCKVEEKVARQSKMQMRFRLGSLDYVNALEQKPHWHLPIKQEK